MQSCLCSRLCGSDLSFHETHNKTTNILFQHIDADQAQHKGKNKYMYLIPKSLRRSVMSVEEILGRLSTALTIRLKSV